MLRTHIFCARCKSLRAHYTHAYERARNIIRLVYTAYYKQTIETGFPFAF